MASYEVYTQGIYRKTKAGDTVLGKAIPVFIHNMDYHLTDLKVFQDGKIDCWGGLIEFEEFKSKVASGWVRTTVPADSRISIFPLGDVTTTEEINYVQEEELIKEVRDAIEGMNDRPTTSQICLQRYQEYQNQPTAEGKKKLKDAYENMPSHKRCYVLGDMNNKDYPIRNIIYGE